MSGAEYLLFILMLSIFLGFELINKVPATLHTPLMSGANAISGITVVGAVALAGTGNETATTYFTYHVYQFVSLQGWPANATPPTLKTLSGVVMHSDNAQNG